MRKAQYIRKVRVSVNKQTLMISIPKTLAKTVGIRKGTKMQWSREGRILSLRKVRESG